MTTPAAELDYEYIAYIDEAGDPGIQKVRPIDKDGASEWLVLSAVVIKKQRGPEMVSLVQGLLSSLQIRQRNDLHFTTLTPNRRLVLCEALASFPCRLFVLASNKKNMRGHKNDRAAKTSGPISSSQYMYNFCARILLERVTDYVEWRSTRDFKDVKKMKIVFSERGGITYGQTAAYAEVLKMQARANNTFLRKWEIKWRTLDHNLIRPGAHDQIAGLQMADAVASAFYQAVDRFEVRKWDTSFAKILAPVVAKLGDTSADYGVVLQPTPPWKALLSPEQAEIFEFYGYRF